MLGVLPALFVVACVAALGASRHGAGRPDLAGGWAGVRDAIAIALLAAGAWSAAGGELLSLGACLTFWPVLAWWAVPTAAMAAYAVRRAAAVARWLRPPAHPDRVIVVLIALTASLLLATGLIALLTPPNSVDALSYHLPRQLLWIQQGSLSHYPSHDLRQLEFPPMAESAGAQMMILAGGGGPPLAAGARDRWANMVPWASFVGCVLVASAMARDLSASGRGQALAALLAATIPTAVQQSVNAKNDPVVALWVCLLVYLALRLRVERRCGPARTVQVGLALGLLLYTKGTGYVFALPIAALIGAWMMASLRPVWSLVPRALVIGALAAALNAPHWQRNYASFGHPLGLSATGKAFRLANETISLPALVSNVVRNLSLHTRAPSTRVNAAQERWITGLHAAMGIDDSEPRTTYPSGFRFFVGWRFNQDMTAGAPIHLILAALGPAAMGVVALSRRPRSPRRDPPDAGHGPADPPGPSEDVRRGPDGAVWGISLTILGMFLIFCLLIKWQPWHARMHLPMLVLLAPVCGLLVSRAPGGIAKGVLPFGAFALAAYAMIFNATKPLVGPNSVFRISREELLFIHVQRIRDAALSVVAAAEPLGPSGGGRGMVVGLTGGFKHCEYPIQRVFLDHATRPVRLVSARPVLGPEPEGPAPDVILAPDATEVRMTWPGKGAARPGSREPSVEYVAVAQFPPITLYAKHDAAAVPADMPFMGWRAVGGLGPSEGPFPTRRIPVVRPALGPRTCLAFDGGGSPVDLVLECRRIGSREQTMEVRLNGVPVHRHTFGRAPILTAHRIPLTPREGPNVIEIRFGTTFTMGPQERAILFRRIQIVPRSAADPPP